MIQQDQNYLVQLSHYEGPSQTCNAIKPAKEKKKVDEALEKLKISWQHTP